MVAPLCSLILFHHVETTAGLTPHGLSFGRRGLDLIRLSFRYRRGKDTEMSVFTTWAKPACIAYDPVNVRDQRDEFSVFSESQAPVFASRQTHWVHVKKKADLSVPSVIEFVEIKILHDD